MLPSECDLLFAGHTAEVAQVKPVLWAACLFTQTVCACAAPTPAASNPASTPEPSNAAALFPEPGPAAPGPTDTGSTPTPGAASAVESAEPKLADGYFVVLESDDDDDLQVAEVDGTVSVMTRQGRALVVQDQLQFDPCHQRGVHVDMSGGALHPRAGVAIWNAVSAQTHQPERRLYRYSTDQGWRRLALALGYREHLQVRDWRADSWLLLTSLDGQTGSHHRLHVLDQAGVRRAPFQFSNQRSILEWSPTNSKWRASCQWMAIEDFHAAPSGDAAVVCRVGQIGQSGGIEVFTPNSKLGKFVPLPLANPEAPGAAAVQVVSRDEIYVLGPATDGVVRLWHYDGKKARPLARNISPHVLTFHTPRGLLFVEPSPEKSDPLTELLPGGQFVERTSPTKLPTTELALGSDGRLWLAATSGSPGRPGRSEVWVETEGHWRNILTIGEATIEQLLVTRNGSAWMAVSQKGKTALITDSPLKSVHVERSNLPDSLTPICE